MNERDSLLSAHSHPHGESCYRTCCSLSVTCPVPMALSSLGGDEVGVVFCRLGNPLEQWLAVDFGSASSGLRVLTQRLQQELKAEHEVAAALCHKVGMRGCKELREAKRIAWFNKGLTAVDLATLGKLGSVLPALEKLSLYERSAGGTAPDGVQRLAVALGVGALPSVTTVAFYNVHVGDAGASALAAALGRGALPQLTSLSLSNAAIGDAGLVALAPLLRQLSTLEYLDLSYMNVGDAGASALAAALGRGALPRLKFLYLTHTAIGDAGLVALAPALRRLPALEYLVLQSNPFGDEGLTALVAPPLPAGAPPTTTGVLTKLKTLDLFFPQVTDAGCATLAAALGSGALPALKKLYLGSIPASAAAKAAVFEARPRAKV